jgi:hypothetical protein
MYVLYVTSPNDCRLTRCDVGQVITIDMLPEEVLLAIFDFFVDEDAFKKRDVEVWQSLVHVCRRWRSVVFGSPRRLNLRLVCGAKTPVRDALDVWPPLPLVIRGCDHQTRGANNIIVGLKRSDRVCRIDLWGHNLSPLDKALAEMQEPFPKLTDLAIKMTTFFSERVTALPDSFLGGSAPHLRCLKLYGIPFPGLPKLLSSATHLVDLQLSNIPHSGYFSPEAVATALSMSTSLKLLSLKFLSSRSRPDQASPRPHPTRSLLPVLDTLRFEGVTEYMDDLVARIDAPRLNNLDVAFWNEIISDIPQFIQFIGRTRTLEVLETAHVTFQVDGAGVRLSSETSGHRELIVKILCGDSEMQLLRVCTSYLPPLSTSEDLYIYESMYPQLDWPNNNTPWLELLRPFTSVKNLYLSDVLASRIAPALQELVGDRTTEVLPALENISLEGIQPWKPVPEGIEKHTIARQLSGHPIAVSPASSWERNMNLQCLDLEFEELEE